MSSERACEVFLDFFRSVREEDSGGLELAIKRWIDADVTRAHRLLGNLGIVGPWITSFNEDEMCLRHWGTGCEIASIRRRWATSVEQLQHRTDHIWTWYVADDGWGSGMFNPKGQCPSKGEAVRAVEQALLDRGWKAVSREDFPGDLP